MDLNTPVSQLNRVGKTVASRLKRLGIVAARDLLFYFPFRYEDYRALLPIADLRPGQAVTVRGRIELIANRRSARRRKIVTEALVTDESGSVRVVWFNQPFLTNTLSSGDTVYLSGVVKGDLLGTQMVSPTYEKVKITSPVIPSLSRRGVLNQHLPCDPLLIKEGGAEPTPPLNKGRCPDQVGRERSITTHTARLVPMYPLTEGLTQKQLRFLMSQVIGLTTRFPEWLPESILEKFDLSPLPSALRGIHFPDDDDDLNASTRRLKFDELFLIQLRAERARLSRQSETAPMLAFQESAIKAFVASLPFALTRTQKVAAWEILQDLQKPVPMNRLLSGDVGSGKTVVAALAMYSAALNGYQSVLMAPTEILAKQHYDSLVKLLGEQGSICLLTRSQFLISDVQFSDKSKIKISKKTVIERINNGEAKIIVGTQALLTESVGFGNLGLVIVDEQHRFGVEQRKLIKDKAAFARPPWRTGLRRAEVSRSHFLSMTATPIPRSLALTLYGDLDLSIISELPPGRKKILTRLVEPHNRQKAYDFIRGQVKSGRQVFVICPLISPKPEVIGHKLDDKKSVMTEYTKLSQQIFPDLKIGYLHGKMPARRSERVRSTEGLSGMSKEEVMDAFIKNEINILVSTSVVEVGVDIPNASVMMIEGAERFGLAQLHQFRGRVGRASHQSYCFLFTEMGTSKALERLGFFETHHDGFKLAEKDLEMRGPGEVYGTQQSGLMNLRLATLADREIIKQAREAAKDTAPRLGDFPILAQRFKTWEQEVHLE